MIGAGLVGAALQAYGLFVAFRSRAWSKAPGRVGSSLLHESLPHRDMAFDVDSASVQYSYEVAGRAYSGSRIRFGLGPFGSGDADDATFYQQFRDVTVYYNPANPDQSVLEPGPAAGQWVLLVLSIIVIAVGYWRLTSA